MYSTPPGRAEVCLAGYACILGAAGTYEHEGMTLEFSGDMVDPGFDGYVRECLGGD